MLELETISKSFGDLCVLSDLSMKALPGRVTAVLGPNAAGKTTLAKIVVGLTRADGGTVRIAGTLADANGAYKAQLGYMPQTPAFPDHLTPTELFALLRDLRGSQGMGDGELAREFELDGHLNKPARALSGGTRQKVNAVIAFLFDPQVLILDEPTSGLDPVAGRILKDHIRSARSRGKTVLLTSHIMSELDELADDVVLLSEGVLQFAGEVAALKRETRQPDIERAVAVMMRRNLAA